MSSRPTRLERCNQCTKKTRSASGLCNECRPRTATRPEVACNVCGIRTTAKGGTCPSCAWLPLGAPSEAHRLTGGRWINVGGIQRWQPWTDEECAERTRAALRAFPTSPAFDELQAARKRLHVLVNECRPTTKEVA